MSRQSRNIAIRVLCLILWLAVFYVVTKMIIGAVVGVIAGVSTTSYEAGYHAGQQASIEFFATYGGFVLIAQLIVFSALAYLGKFPGVSKYK